MSDSFSFAPGGPELSHAEQSSRHALNILGDIEAKAIQLPADLAAELNKINLEGTAREAQVVEELDLLHASVKKFDEEYKLLDKDGQPFYDSFTISPHSVLNVIYNYKIIADVLAYSLSFEWDIVMEFLSVAITAAITPKVVFLQSAKAVSLVFHNERAAVIVFKICMYKGYFNYAILAAIGHITMETGLFNSSPVLRTFRAEYGNKSYLSISHTKFPENSRSRLIKKTFEEKLDQSRVKGLALIVEGFLKSRKPAGRNLIIDVEVIETVGMSSCNLFDKGIIRSHIDKTEKEILKINSSSSYNEHIQVNNVERALLREKVIVRGLNVVERQYLDDIIRRVF